MSWAIFKPIRNSVMETVRMETITISEILADAVKSSPGVTRAISDDLVRERAYLLWEEAGRPEGDGVEFWLMAERELSA